MTTVFAQVARNVWKFCVHSRAEAKIPEIPQGLMARRVA
eukprot:CAMPEP_0179841540 /NCGR_PEP_ID=MMETSP0982-20121206/2597_1 /TAXON_ID=483367 /ORGANISM="non described non described, Strain CCMP 2436" /LENGTH=38 /DNA_ID= /DNA_START= /DNA_END= /DNA_ORIENTATION=